MMKLESDLKLALKQAFLELYDLALEDEACTLQITRKEFQGDFSLVVFPFAKRCHQQPEKVAHAIGKWVQLHTSIVDSYNVVHGFLNLVIHDSVWLTILDQVITQSDYGRLKGNNLHVVVEFSCPNTNKPQHLGHLRNNFLGSALANILDAAGYSVHRVNLINDRGIHICKSMVAYQKFGHGETPQSSGMKGDHLVGKYYVKFNQVYCQQLDELKKEGEDKDTAVPPILKEAQNMLVDWENGEPSVRQLWEKMNAWVYCGFQATYDQLGIVFDKTYYESDTYLLGKTIVQEGLDKKCFYAKEDGAIAVDLALYGLGEKVLLRSDGTAVYITQDLGTADLRYADYHFDKMIYVVGNEQAHHFKVLFAILECLGRPYAKKMSHFPYGMVELPCGKMKSREGHVVDADNLIEEMMATVMAYTKHSHKINNLDQDNLQKLCHTLALGALKFFILRVNPKKTMLFNPNDSIDFQGDTGTFIQYTYARICSLKRKAKAYINFSLESYSEPLADLERDLSFQLYLFPFQVEQAASTCMPSIIANYALELAKLYNKYYAMYPILKEELVEIQKFRLLLSDAVGRVLQKSMQLLTISLPGRM